MLDEWSVLRSARITQWKELLDVKVSQTGEKYRLILLQTRRIIATCVYRGFFRRWKTRALRSERIMEWKERLNVEVSQTGEKYHLIFYKIYELLQFECIWACFDAGREACTTLCTHDAVKRAFKRRNIWNGREISLNFLQNLRIIAIWVYLFLCLRWTSGVYYVLHA